MMALMFLAGFICGVVFLGIVGYAFTVGRNHGLVLELDEEEFWNHPELQTLLEGKATIKRLN